MGFLKFLKNLKKIVFLYFELIYILFLKEKKTLSDKLKKINSKEKIILFFLLCPFTTGLFILGWFLICIHILLYIALYIKKYILKYFFKQPQFSIIFLTKTTDSENFIFLYLKIWNNTFKKRAFYLTYMFLKILKNIKNKKSKIDFNTKIFFIPKLFFTYIIKYFFIFLTYFSIFTIDTSIDFLKIIKKNINSNFSKEIKTKIFYILIDLNQTIDYQFSKQIEGKKINFLDEGVEFNPPKNYVNVTDSIIETLITELKKEKIIVSESHIKSIKDILNDIVINQNIKMVKFKSDVENEEFEEHKESSPTINELTIDKSIKNWNLEGINTSKSGFEKKPHISLITDLGSQVMTIRETKSTSVPTKWYSVEEKKWIQGEMPTYFEDQGSINPNINARKTLAIFTNPENIVEIPNITLVQKIANNEINKFTFSKAVMNAWVNNVYYWKWQLLLRDPNYVTLQHKILYDPNFPRKSEVSQALFELSKIFEENFKIFTESKNGELLADLVIYMIKNEQNIIDAQILEIILKKIGFE